MLSLGMHPALLGLLLKELREQRSALVVTPVVLSALALAVGLTVPLGSFPAAPTLLFVIAAGATALVAVVGDLVPGEFRRGQFGYLQRMPGGLPAAFAAKSVVAVVASGFLVGCGYACGLLADEMAAWRAPADLVAYAGGTRSGSDPAMQWILFGLVGLGAWTLPVSCVSARGAGVLPSTIALVALFVLPVGVLFSLQRLPFRVEDGWPWYVGLVAVGSAGGAWTFVSGLKHGRTLRTFVLFGASVVAFAGPVSVWCGLEAWSWFRPSLSGDGRLRIDGVVVAPDGRGAVLDVRRELGTPGRRAPSYLFALDLEAGTHRLVAGPRAHTCPWLPNWGIALDYRQPQAVVPMMRAGAWTDRWSEGEVLDLTKPLGSWEPGVDPSARQRAVAVGQWAFTLPDGASARVEGSERVVVREAGGGRSTIALPGSGHLRPAGAWVYGHGFGLFDPDLGRSTHVVDLVARRVVGIPEILVGARICIAGRRWIVRRYGDRYGLGPLKPSVYDPATGELVAAPALDDAGYDVLPDGRLAAVVYREEARGVGQGATPRHRPESFLFDPVTQHVELLRLAGEPGALVAVTCHGALPCVTAAGAPVLAAGLFEIGADGRCVTNESVVCRLDGSTLVPTARIGGRSSFALLPDGGVLAIERGVRVLRLEFGSDRREVVLDLRGGSGRD